MITRPGPTMLLLLLSAVSVLHFASGDINSAGRGTNRFSAQIAHHTDLPYIRDPVEPSNVVDGPLPGEGEYTSTSLGSDTTSTTDSAVPGSNDEDNSVDIVPAPFLHPGPHYAGTPAPYEHPHPPPQYGLSHQWYRLSARPVYEVKTFKCDFEHHTCGMRNQKIIGPHFKLVRGNVGNRPGYYMAVDSQSIPPGVSRLITPYLPGHPNSLVCLQLTYAVYGQGAERIQVVAQDVGNRPLFTLERDGRSWRTFGINMTVHQDVRFFIEAYTNGKPGVIAIDDFTYSFDPCR
ncbi:uncharacterized protein LOC144108775 isoform X1 [Amblyomma americanum]